VGAGAHDRGGAGTPRARARCTARAIHRTAARGGLNFRKYACAQIEMSELKVI
jgi:hypothetical protein